MFEFDVHTRRSAEYLVTGLPGIGRVGHVAAHYLVNELNPEHVATIYSDYFPPQVGIDDGVLRLFRNEVYYVDAEKPFFLLTGDSQPVGATPREHYEYAREVVSFFSRMGVREIYTMAGIDRGPMRFSMKPGVVVAATDREILDFFISRGAQADPSGAITGAAGLLLGIGARHGIRGACLMGETSAQLTMHGDPGAALAVLELLLPVLGADVDLSAMREAAEKLDTLFRNMASKKEEQKQEERLDYIG